MTQPGWLGLDERQWRTLIWAGLAVVLGSFDGSILVLALPAVATEFHAQTPAISNLGSVLALGAVGSLPLATLADRFGRRRLIAVAVAGFSVANFLSGFAPSLGALALLRLVAVCFETLVGGVATALIVEEAPPDRRGQAVSVLALLSGGGLGIAVVAYPIVAPHWRWLFLAGGLGILLAPAVWRNLPEGRVWLRVRITTSALRLLFTPPWRRRVLILAGVGGLGAVMFRPAGLLFTLYANQSLHMSATAISLLITASGITGAVSYLAGGYLTDRFGRRTPAIALATTTTIAASLSFATGAAGFVLGNILWSVLASASVPVSGAWSAELYPTRARATAEAVNALVGAAGGVAGLQAVGLLSQAIGLGRALELSGVAAFAGACLLILLPETKHEPLPE